MSSSKRTHKKRKHQEGDGNTAPQTRRAATITHTPVQIITDSDDSDGGNGSDGGDQGPHHVEPQQQEEPVLNKNLYKPRKPFTFKEQTILWDALKAQMIVS